ncbi:6-phosphofructokinase [Candidatus Soleaferrea massiliensis]|uniref:6-phosphofructokinase n=1 Tax=Candidatus Soleaferrea massiliensis TaxID=1470354 RepID=UPI00058DD323|nr:ATP-dependent 6-phosphofructokinase [Candidatus Soleaferrea massiliensis]
MKRRIGILTSGGDCPGLNAVIRGVAKAAYQRMNEVEIVGIVDGYSGLINGEYREMQPSDFSGILTIGGTILGTSRQPFKKMKVIENDVDKVANMKENYKKMGLDCLLILGGNGTHKTAHLLAEEGLNVIGLPKTIDNDIWGTEVTFGFHTAVDIATEAIDRIHTTAASHGRVMIVELMGNKAGWLTLYAGIAGGSDIILLPELPFDMDKVIEAVVKRAHDGKAFSIIAVAEGAMDKKEAALKKKERLRLRQENGEHTISQRIVNAIAHTTGMESRLVVPGHLQRGGSPSAYDRVLSTQFGVFAAELVEKEQYGVSVALLNDQVVANPLSEVAGKTKLVPADHRLIKCAKRAGISFGD